MAAAGGHANVLKVLSRTNGFNLEARDKNGRTPLHWAAAAAHLKTVHSLLALGADPTVKDLVGKLPRDYALAHSTVQHRQCAEILRDAEDQFQASGRLRRSQALSVSQQSLVEDGDSDSEAPGAARRSTFGVMARLSRVFGSRKSSTGDASSVTTLPTIGGAGAAAAGSSAMIPQTYDELLDSSRKKKAAQRQAQDELERMEEERLRNTHDLSVTPEPADDRSKQHHKPSDSTRSSKDNKKKKDKSPDGHADRNAKGGDGLRLPAINNSKRKNARSSPPDGAAAPEPKLDAASSAATDASELLRAEQHAHKLTRRRLDKLQQHTLQLETRLATTHEVSEV